MGLKSGSQDASLDDEADDGDGDGDDDPTPDAGAEADQDHAADDRPESTARRGGADADAGTDATSETGDTDPAADTDDPGAGESAAGSTGDPVGTAGGAHPSLDAIPYKLRRESVNQDREQVPFFLRETVLDGEDELRTTLEAELGEHVYKSDFREAAMVLAQRNPDLVADILREWGYDLD